MASINVVEDGELEVVRQDWQIGLIVSTLSEAAKENGIGYKRAEAICEELHEHVGNAFDDLKYNAVALHRTLYAIAFGGEHDSMERFSASVQELFNAAKAGGMVEDRAEELRSKLTGNTVASADSIVQCIRTALHQIGGYKEFMGYMHSQIHG